MMLYTILTPPTAPAVQLNPQWVLWSFSGSDISNTHLVSISLNLYFDCNDTMVRQLLTSTLSVSDCESFPLARESCHLLVGEERLPLPVSAKGCAKEFVVHYGRQL